MASLTLTAKQFAAATKFQLMNEIEKAIYELASGGLTLRLKEYAYDIGRSNQDIRLVIVDDRLTVVRDATALSIRVADVSAEWFATVFSAMEFACCPEIRCVCGPPDTSQHRRSLGALSVNDVRLLHGMEELGR